MSDIFKKRMALCGNTVSDSIRTQSDEIMQKTFTNDLGYRQCKLYSRTMEYLEDVEIKYQYSQTYTINKDQVEYLAQFRPGYFPEKKYMDQDSIERFGFYLEIPDKNTGVHELWLILGKNDKNSFIRYNILKCNWMFKWIKNKQIYSCFGVLRNRNNYNSGVWSDGFFTSVDNQSQFIVPTTPTTQTIHYNDRFMLSDSMIRPLVFEVSKLEDTFPCGVTKVTLKQDHFNKVTDNVELKICDYYDSPVIPQEPEIEDIVLSCSGTNRALRVGGSKRTISVASDIKDKSVIWSNEFNGNKLSVEELSNDFEISEGKNTLSIKALLNYNNLGKVIKIIATLPNKQPSSIELEVMR